MTFLMRMFLFLLLLVFSSLCLAEEQTYYRNNYNYPKYVKTQIDTSLLGQCFALVAQRYISRGKSLSNKIKDIRFANNVMDYNSLRNYLSRYEDYKLYQTGYENNLDTWVLLQKDNSITALGIFKKSLEFNHGDLFKTFLLIYNSLYRNARWDKDMIPFKSSYSRMYRYFNKFTDIRGDLDDRRDGSTGDHIGTWYRMWGTMVLYIYSTGYQFENKNDFTFLSGPEWEYKTEAAYYFAMAHAEIAERIKPYMKYAWWNNQNKWEEVDTRKTEFNKAGVSIASEFFYL